jgi:hypothetical protein
MIRSLKYGRRELSVAFDKKIRAARRQRLDEIICRTNACKSWRAHFAYVCCDCDAAPRDFFAMQINLLLRSRRLRDATRKKRRHIEGSARHFDLPVLKRRTSAMNSFMKSHFINL